MSAITIPVSDQTAEAWNEAPPEIRAKAAVLLELGWRRMTGPGDPEAVAQFLAVLDEIGAEANAAGLTDADLETLIRGDATKPAPRHAARYRQ